jgi:hypothetical protein
MNARRTDDMVSWLSQCTTVGEFEWARAAGRTKIDVHSAQRAGPGNA